MSKTTTEQDAATLAALEREHAGYVARKAQAESVKDEELADRMQGRADQVLQEVERIGGKPAADRLRKGGAETR